MRSALPADFKAEDIETLRVIKIDPLEKNLSKRVLGLSHYKKNNEDSNEILIQLIKNPIAYLGYIENVDYNSKKLEVLLPNTHTQNVGAVALNG